MMIRVVEAVVEAVVDGFNTSNKSRIPDSSSCHETMEEEAREEEPGSVPLVPIVPTVVPPPHPLMVPSSQMSQM